MVKKSHFLTSIRLFKKHLSRLITIVAIVMVSVGFMAGLGEVENHIKAAINDFYYSHYVADLYIKSTSTTGFSEEQLDALKEKFGEENIKESFCYELSINDRWTRLYVFDLSNNKINHLDLLEEGNWPEQAGEVLVERQTYGIKSYNVGDEIDVNIFGMHTTLKVSGIVRNPYLIYERAEMSFTEVAPKSGEYKTLEDAIYIDYAHVSDMAGINFTMVNDVYIFIPSIRHKFNSYEAQYERKISSIRDETEEIFLKKTDGSIVENPDGIPKEYSAKVLTLYENMGLYSLDSYAGKIGIIGVIFIVFFMAVSLLVIYSAMSRLFEEERQQIACLKTLGYDDFQTISKYILFDFVGTAAGCGLGFFVSQLLTRIIYNVFNLQYSMPPYPTTGGAYYYLGVALIMLLSTMLLTYLTGMNTVRQRPVTLLSRKAPKAGRKVLAEKIPIIWNHLSFKHKSTVRNVFLFRSRFFMTVISVIGATVLVLAGLGVMDNSITIPDGQALLSISIVVIVFSALLCALVIYNITNINVSERNREIATLMVLGYSDEEVAGYIFREIYVMCARGALLGLPFGAAFMEFIFEFVDFGTIEGVNWWTWLCTPFITMFFCVISTRLLKRKITSIDMNASLKTLE